MQRACSQLLLLMHEQEQYHTLWAIELCRWAVVILLWWAHHYIYNQLSWEAWSCIGASWSHGHAHPHVLLQFWGHQNSDCKLSVHFDPSTVWDYRKVVGRRCAHYTCPSESGSVGEERWHWNSPRKTCLSAGVDEGKFGKGGGKEWVWGVSAD